MLVIFYLDLLIKKILKHFEFNIHVQELSTIHILVMRWLNKKIS